jgi:predicted ATP-grasp superfamily ATP-dependent carboligase
MNFTSHIPGAVILGGSFASVEAARNLAKHGVKVCVFGSTTSVARFSRSVNIFLKWPANLKNDEIPGMLVNISKKCCMQGWALFPSSDEDLRIVAQNSKLLAEYFIITVPPWETVKFLYDKRLTYALAQEAGVAIPHTHIPENEDRLFELDMDYPVVLKPAISSLFCKKTNRKAFLVNNLQELQRLYESMSQVVGSSQVIIQEFLPEPSENLFSFAGYFKEGKPIVGLSVKRTRQFPIDFGRTSSFVETVEVPELRELASQLLQAIRYTGLAEVEFMWDEKSARFLLIEVNARLWAWHGISNATGLNLPYAACTNYEGLNSTPGTMRQGIKWVRLLTDVRAAAQGIRSGSLNVWQYLTSLYGPTSFSLFSLSDPMPFIAEPFLLLFDRLKKLA